jgi:hypothetical protein
MGRLIIFFKKSIGNQCCPCQSFKKRKLTTRASEGKGASESRLAGAGRTAMKDSGKFLRLSLDKKQPRFGV